MKKFSLLFSQLDQTNKTGDKLKLLVSYFSTASDLDSLWTLALFTHKRPKRSVNTRQLREWCCEFAEISPWIFEESYQTVGDLAETIALLLPLATSSSDQPLHFWIDFLESVKDLDESAKKAAIFNAWTTLTKEERLVFNKLITGGFRIGVSQNLITRALAETFGLEKTEVTHRIWVNGIPEGRFQRHVAETDLATNFIPAPILSSWPTLSEQPSELKRSESDWQARNGNGMASVGLII